MKNQSNTNGAPESSTFTSNIPRIISLLALLVIGVVFVNESRAAGTLSLNAAGDLPLEIRDHQVSVTIQNGFARTSVSQVFYNSNPRSVEGLYTFPVPKQGSLSEVTILAGDNEMKGEVVEKDRAEQIYEAETSRGNQAGLTQKDGYRDFEFWVAPIPANSEVKLQFTYYEPLELDHGIGRYLYTLEEGGTEEVIPQFWSRNSSVQNSLSIEVEFKSAWPVADIRTPGFNTTQWESEQSRFTRFESAGGDLNKDFVLYYRLQDNLPGRIEVVLFKASTELPGTFMMVVTPGVDLKPLDQGSDYIFVLDVSGSMSGKLGTLVAGVKQTIKTFRPQDRFRIVVFNDESRELTKTWLPATPEQVDHAVELLDRAQSGGGTNLYSGLKRGLDSLDSDRVTSMILVTDGVTNKGIVDAKDFDALMSQSDIRFFGFLLGNQSNWPLMETVCNATGGHYKAVSNSDDIIGQILLAKSKVLHESIHDFDLKIRGVDAFDVSPTQIKKVFRGQQLVFFGRYADGGEADLEISARISGQDKLYTTRFQFPELDTDNPELERLWALNRIQFLEQQKRLGLTDASESESAISDLSLQYQLVTDYTSMLVLSDEQFEQYGIDRRNLARTDIEQIAQMQRAQQPTINYRVDNNKPAFSENAPAPTYNGGVGGGAGSISEWVAVFIVALLALVARRTFAA
jgi:Ca-activated chloride channel family protein